ncbi:ABC transporter [Halomontanus rarus]|uniref:ABC transporter n=1 Tax=Halomontanus rarus TaxID=3034020 RepID=UPI0023E86D5F|nr:ABC transporter [Halovivax sp. TS33]
MTTIGRGLSLPARAVLEKKVILWRRYWINTAFGFLGAYLFFAMIFFGGQAVAGAAITDTLDGIIVGFFLFSVAISAYHSTSGQVTREAQWGTLEQLYMSPSGMGTLMAVKTAVNICTSIAGGLVLLAMMLATTDQTLSIDAVTVVPLVVVTTLSVVGLGFVFAGFALLYKRIENVFQLLQFGLIALIATPVDGRAWLKALPLSQGSSLLQEAMTEGTRLWEFPAVELAVLVANGLCYLAVGYLTFHLLLRRARKLGVMGHY